MYDCETTGGSFHQDHIMETDTTVIIPDGMSISNEEFCSLCHTSLHIVHKGFYYFIAANCLYCVLL